MLWEQGPDGSLVPPAGLGPQEKLESKQEELTKAPVKYFWPFSISPYPARFVWSEPIHAEKVMTDDC
ncbi:hypothetical protein ILYODFUR_003769 [Ilyodon furcidens]|uniref:Uncharacterized protein n=1 Tax=Ilyodon furcidens TaxID=33524 RepID=A0ABV0V144_9TELE